MNNENEKSHFQIGRVRTIPERKNSTAPQSQMPVKRNSPFISWTTKKKRRFSLQPRRLIFPLIALILAYFLLSYWTEKKIGPVMGEIAEKSAHQHLLETVNQTVRDMAREGLLGYDKMVHALRDEKGEVIYLEVDTAMLAGAKAELVERVGADLKENDDIRLRVPLGRLTGWQILAGVGVPVRVRLYAIEMTEGEITTELEDCGINQTRHLIGVTVHASLFLVLPGENRQVDTEVNIPLGERVLVGEVPEIYLDTLGVG